MAEAACPASCGELIQGWLQGGEKLISCPIDWYSTVSVTQGAPNYQLERPLMRKALKLTLNYFKISSTFEAQLRIEFDSTIPVAKGMASSTADIAATIVATTRFLEQTISEQDIALLCAHLEPTDSTPISTLALFDHNRGEIITKLSGFNALDILILESPICVETSLYHLIDRGQALRDSAPQLETAYQTLRAALDTQSPRQFGQACMISAQQSQKILRKPRFPCLLDIVERHDLYGLNVAHSGSVVGMLFDSSKHDIESVIHDIQGIATEHYPNFHLTKLVNGGVR